MSKRIITQWAFIIFQLMLVAASLILFFSDKGYFLHLVMVFVYSFIAYSWWKEIPIIKETESFLKEESYNDFDDWSNEED